MFGEFDPEGSPDDEAKQMLVIVAAIAIGAVVLIGGCVTCSGLFFLYDRIGA